MRQTRKSRNKLEIIGKGKYGCVVKPALDCKHTFKSGQTLVSKIYATIQSETHIPEIKNVEEIIKRCGPEIHKYCILPIANCELTEGQKKLPIIKQCQKTFKIHKNLNSFLQIPIADGDLDIFLKQQEKTHNLEVINALRNLIVGLKLLHSHNIVHNDIKPNNILYGYHKTKSGSSKSSNKLWFKFADFGSVRIDPTEDYYKDDTKRMTNTINKFLKKWNEELNNNGSTRLPSFKIRSNITRSFNTKNIYIHTNGIEDINQLLEAFDKKIASQQ